MLRSIDKYLARDANYPLNVRAHGGRHHPRATLRLLRRIGQWHRTVKESLDSATPASYLTANRNARNAARAGQRLAARRRKFF